MYKFLLNHLVKFLKVLLNLKFKIKFPFEFSPGFGPTGPALPASAQPSPQARLAHELMAPPWKCVSLFGLRLPSWFPSL
jgi:hypothetical protein